MSTTTLRSQTGDHIGTYDPDTHRLLLTGDDPDGPRGWQPVGSPESPWPGSRYAYSHGGTEYRAACEAVRALLGSWEAVGAAAARAAGEMPAA